MSDSTDIKAAIAAAMTSGSRTVLLDARTYNLDPVPYGTSNFLIDAAMVGLRIVGRGWGATTIRQSDNALGSTRVFDIQAPGVELIGFTLDGGDQRVIDDGKPDEHRSGFFVRAPGFKASSVEARGFSGDGGYLYAGANDAQILDCRIHHNIRNGITFGAMMDNVSLLTSAFIGNGAQQVDTEPGAGSIVSGLMLHRCLLDGGGVSDDYVLTLGGSNPGASEGHDVAIVDCTLNGGVYVVWGNRIVIDGCDGNNNTSKSCIELWRTTSQVDIVRCKFKNIQNKHAIYITGTGGTSTPDRIRIVDCAVTTPSFNSSAISINAVSTASVAGCILEGSYIKCSGSSGVAVRTTNFDTPIKRVEILDNRIFGFGDRGLGMGGNSYIDVNGVKHYASIGELRVVGNNFGGGVQATGMVLDDGTGIVKKLVIGQNTFDADVVTQQQPSTLPLCDVYPV